MLFFGYIIGYSILGVCTLHVVGLNRLNRVFSREKFTLSEYLVHLLIWPAIAVSALME